MSDAEAERRANRTPMIDNPVLTASRRVLQLVRRTAPDNIEPGPTADIHTLAMFVRSMRLYDGVITLLEAELPEEATVLARSLFEDSLRLDHLAANFDDRYAYVLSWANDSITEAIGLFREAQSLGLDDDPREAIADKEMRRRELQEYQHRNGIKKLRRFPSTKHLARLYRDAEDAWFYAATHEFVHGSEIAWFWGGRSRRGKNHVALFGKTDEAWFIASVAAFATESVSKATAATARLFGWTNSPDFATALEAVFEAWKAASSGAETTTEKDAGGKTDGAH
jgi:hypothetical protein